jgi:hypothetical protein
MLRQPTNSYIIFLSCWAAHKLFYNFGQQNFSLWQSFIKQSTQQRGEKEEQRNRSQVPTKSSKTQSGFQRAKEQIMFQSPPHQSQKAYPREKMKFQSFKNLEKPSLAMGNAPQNRNEQVLRLEFSC